MKVKIIFVDSYTPRSIEFRICKIPRYSGNFVIVENISTDCHSRNVLNITFYNMTNIKEVITTD